MCLQFSQVWAQEWDCWGKCSTHALVLEKPLDFSKPDLYLFFWLRWVRVAARGRSLAVGAGANSLAGVQGPRIRRLLLPWRQLLGMRAPALQHVGSRAQAQWWRGAGLAAPQRVESSRPGIEPSSPAVAGGFLTTGPSGRPSNLCFQKVVSGFILIREERFPL